MKRRRSGIGMRRAASVVVITIAALAGAPVSGTAQVIDLSVPGGAGSAFEWFGPKSNARAGASLLRADMSGDVDRTDLIVGAPGAGSGGEGQAYIFFMGPPYGTAA